MDLDEDLGCWIFDYGMDIRLLDNGLLGSQVLEFWVCGFEYEDLGCWIFNH